MNSGVKKSLFSFLTVSIITLAGCAPISILSGSKAADQLKKITWNYPSKLFSSRHVYRLRGPVRDIKWEGRYQIKDDDSDIALLEKKTISFNRLGLRTAITIDGNGRFYEERLKFDGSDVSEKVAWNNKELINWQKVEYAGDRVVKLKPIKPDSDMASTLGENVFLIDEKMADDMCFNVTHKQEGLLQEQYVEKCDGKKITLNIIDENGLPIALLTFLTLPEKEEQTPEFSDYAEVYEYDIENRMRTLETYNKGILTREDRYLYDAEGQLVMIASQFHGEMSWREEIIFSKHKLDKYRNWTFRRAEIRTAGKDAHNKLRITEERRRITYYR